ncbi:MAG: sugar ABC transporter permease [Acidobacteria bacterium]|nr:MAG: sugar ABC transporter permease [Acidobacteriota bacterium]
MKRKSAALWFLPALVLLSIVVLYPVIRTLALSFFHDSLATGFRAEFAGLANFRRLVFDSRFHSSLLTTTFFTVVSVAVEFLFGLLLALSVDALHGWRSLVRTIFLVPWTLPTAIIAVLWSWIFNDQYGVLNAVLMRMGLVESPVTWLAAPSTAMFAIIAADVWKSFPFVFIILLAGLQNIPQDLYEAIQIDGGGRWASFRYVTWPHLLPFVFVALIFRLVQAFAVFDLVWVMTGGGPGGATETVSIYTYQTYMRYLDLGYGSAMAVTPVAILALLGIALYRLVQMKYEELF